MFDSGKILDSYTPIQALYIKEYAAGLLVTWTKEHINNLISPDIGDGFHAPDGTYDSEQQEWDAHGAVCQLLDRWLDDALVQAGFRSVDDVPNVGGSKYPTLPKDCDHT